MTENGTTLTVVLFPVVLVALAESFVVRQLLAFVDNVARSRQGANKPTAKETLDRRYAAGEITREEYLKIRNDITREQNA